MDIQLTKNADALICLLYKQYCQKRKNGISKDIAIAFGSSANIYECINTKMQYSDIDAACSELKDSSLLICAYAENVVCDSYLSDKGILYMENRFKNGLKEVIDYLSKFKSIISI
ncbi:hypothetical protein [Clostridium felsineum]|uniref:Uncharacterized protein n=1 Tax=Clostridium felsineum TaxID=36839 RepID=A0A1S8MDM6_9CLOT|nr:hypothetical protein [Clostridium felsineum]URZ06427.1 hypothetical protein CLROS_017600 [Clostridium felsineum]URZ11462.1 hypothetical protein CROST_021790 [Clostridium felsineum]